MTSSIYPLEIDLASTPVSAATDILQNDIQISNDMVKPGGGGILRLLFSFTFATSPATVSIYNNSAFKGNLNADNTSQVVDDGYYRFDIDVEAGDSINVQSTEIVNTINELRAHLVQFGA